MKKIIKVLFLILSITACSNTKAQEIPANDGYKYVISNIYTDQAKADLKQIMKEAGLKDSNIKRFYEQVDFFNKNIDSKLIITDDYKKDDKIPDYDVYAMQDQMFEKYPEFPGINCRITTFGLVSNFIDVDPSNEDNEITTIDNASFTNPPVKTLDKDKIGSFNSFYRPFEINNPDDLSQTQNQISDFLKAAINIKDSDKFSIISVYVPTNASPDFNELFVGHTGILFDLDDGRIMLVEKLAFTAPYQAIVFESREDLRSYLMDLYDSSIEEYPIKPIIFENEKELK